MTNKKPIKKGKTPKQTSKNIKDVLKDCGTVTPPPYEPDVEFLHNIVRAEMAVVKTEEEKKAREEEKEDRYSKLNSFTFYTMGDIKTFEDIVIGSKFYSTDCYDDMKKKLHSHYNKWVTAYIIISLGLGATAMFLILNT